MLMIKIKRIRIKMIKKRVNLNKKARRNTPTLAP